MTIASSRASIRIRNPDDDTAAGAGDIWVFSLACEQFRARPLARPTRAYSTPMSPGCKRRGGARRRCSVLDARVLPPSGFAKTSEIPGRPSQLGIPHRIEVECDQENRGSQIAERKGRSGKDTNDRFDAAAGDAERVNESSQGQHGGRDEPRSGVEEATIQQVGDY